VNKVVNLSAILFASVVGGVIGAYSTNQIYAEKADEHFSSAIKEYLEYPQGSMAVYMGTITAAEKGNTDSLIRINCVLLRGKIGHVHPDLAPNLERRQEMEELKAEAQEMVARLTEQGLCSI